MSFRDDLIKNQKAIVRQAEADAQQAENDELRRAQEAAEAIVEELKKNAVQMVAEKKISHTLFGSKPYITVRFDTYAYCHLKPKPTWYTCLQTDDFVRRLAQKEGFEKISIKRSESKDDFYTKRYYSVSATMYL